MGSSFLEVPKIRRLEKPALIQSALSSGLDLMTSEDLSDLSFSVFLNLDI